ncbi:hypothetical protein CALCODRAFT_92142 [Calocera cornea HHB12733]|uniref:Uncharacterized protein n=1 Tax=Calocera cornea HHB12733 TaxID=1353952 RepID=A0A165D9K8_9BASI|nr:hypothetical protein CALCODRAFT_92142 [Calocera cornea HHB12733]
MTDVGGGCVTNDQKYSANRIPLVWMLREIALSGLGIRFNTAALERDEIVDPYKAIQHGWGMKVSDLDMRYTKDVEAPIFDWLDIDKWWWWLEILPFTYRVPRGSKKSGGKGQNGLPQSGYHNKKKPHSKWKLSPWPNMGHYRNLPTSNWKVHHSVFEREEQKGSSYKVRWSDENQPEWVY